MRSAYLSTVAFVMSLFGAAAIGDAAAAGCELQTSTDDFTDELSKSLVCRPTDTAYRFALVVKCENGRHLGAAFISSLVFPGFGEGFLPVKYRFDKGKVVANRWQRIENGHAVLANEGESLQFAKTLAESERLVVQAGDEKQSFDLKDAAAEVYEVLAFCGLP